MNEMIPPRRGGIVTRPPALDPSDRKSYFDALLTRVIFITGDAAILRGHLRPKDKLTISQWKTSSGTNYVPAFTSLGRLQRAILLPCTALSIQARDLFRILRPAQIVVNPGSPDSVPLTPQERWKIAPQGFWSASSKPDLEALPLKRFMLLPLALQEDLRRFFRSIKAVKNAYIQNIVPAKDDRPTQLLLAIDFRGDGERLASSLAEIVTRSIGSADALELHVSSGDFGQLSEEMYQLIYRRKKGWDLL